MHSVPSPFPQSTTLYVYVVYYIAFLRLLMSIRAEEKRSFVLVGDCKNIQLKNFANELLRLSSLRKKRTTDTRNCTWNEMSFGAISDEEL